MSNVAPLDHERYAVRGDPPQTHEIVRTEAKAPSMQAHPPVPVTAELGRRDPVDRGGATRSFPRPLEPLIRWLDRDPDHPLNGPHPTDLTRLFGMLSEVSNSPKYRLATSPRRVAAL